MASLDGPDARRLDERTDPADRSLPPEAGSAIVDGYRPFLEELRHGPGDPSHHARVLAAFDRFRVLVAHRSGERGLGRLNDECRTVLVGAGLLPDAPGDDLVPGLPLMVLANDYGLRRFNGEIGIAVRRPGSAAGSLSVAFPGLAPGTVEYLSPSRLPSFEPAFALTVHKSQGSEFETVLLVMPRRDSPLATRELVYTGATRARSRLLVLADPGVLARAIERPIRRASGLGERVWGSVEPG